MSPKDVTVLRALLALFRGSLNREWMVDQETRPAEVFLVDVDSEEGQRQWPAMAAAGGLNVAVSSTPAFAAQRLILKPWHRPGENSMVAVLNSLPEVNEGKGDARREANPPPHGSFPAPAQEMRQDFASLLEKLIAESRVAHLRIGDLPPISVDAPRQTYTCSLRPLSLLYHLKARGKQKIELSAHAPPLDPIAESRPLLQLSWLSRLASRDAPVKEDRVVRLTRWPTFTQYPCEPVHLSLAAILLRQSASVAQLASLADSTTADVSAFIHACDLLELVREERAAVEPQARAPVVQMSAPARVLPSVSQPQPFSAPLPPAVVPQRQRAVAAAATPNAAKAGLLRKVLSAIQMRHS